MAYNTNQDRLSHKTVTNLEQSLGKHGITPLIGQTSVSGLNGVAIHFITDCQVEVLKISGFDFNTTTLAGNKVIADSGSFTFTAGTILYGNVTDVKLAATNQLAIVYNA
jgi:hypothetical protein